MIENIGIVPASGILDRYRFAIWDCFSESGSTYNRKLHFHDFYELTLVYEGSCTYLVNGNRFDMTVGDIQLVTPSDYHMQILTDDQTFRYYNLIFSHELPNEEISAMLNAMTEPLCLSPSSADRSHIFRSAQNLLGEYDRLINGRAEFGSELLIRNGIEEICIQLLRLLNKQNTAEDDRLKPVRQALVYISRNYRSHLTLSDVAEAVHLSPAYFSMLFSKTMKTCFSDYLTDYRLNMAARYLRSGDLPLKEIASVCGFATFSHFSATFKKRFGLPPSAYRKS